MFIYHRKPDGAVLAALETRDPIYERSLERSGIEFDVLTVPDAKAPAADQLQRATVREVEVEKAGKKVREQQVQLDREGTVH